MTVTGWPARAPRAPDASPAPDPRPEIEWLIDNAQAYASLLDAIRVARRSVWIAQLALDADCVAHARDGGADENVLDALLVAASRLEVDVRVLLNATLLLDTARPLQRSLDARPSGDRIRVRGVRRFPQLLHAKIVIIDGSHAFLLGSPFANGYWDDSTHRPVDARRPVRELGGRPVHDVSVRVAGAAVRQLERVFRELWQSAAPEGATEIDHREHSPAHGAQGAPPRIVCTAPRGALRTRPEGSTEILDALLDGIGRARSLIYIEHQYLSARPVVAALADALRREPALELVMVLNQNPDVTAYRRWQNARLREHGLLEHPRAGVFGLWSAARSLERGGVTVVNQIFVHSKAVIIDDAWAMLGTANLDGVSLHSYGDDFAGPIMRRVFRDVRNFDVNVVSDSPRCTRSITDLRERLWGEHLGLSRARLAKRPREGWLATWRARARDFTSALNGGALPAKSGGLRAHVLPFSHQPTPRRQLAAAGVRLGAGLDIRFDPSWLEVHCSPGWVRNMFA
ncbi:MAG: phospholipase D-like domain-containing protein [Gemmatimonadaceae bacterium]